ncbi:MAG: glycosyltransferase family 4 protein [Candidatus Omnitrophota bacterium]
MKVLLAHNFYGSSAPSGENTVFLAESALLRQKGHCVLEFTRHSDEIRGRGAVGTLQGALSTPWNPFSANKLQSVLRWERPDILHVHNFSPLLSPSIFHAAAGFETATVMTLHNYRLFCAAGIPMRNGKPCTFCLDQKSVIPALRFGCYRGSRVATAPMALMIALHRGLQTWKHHVDAFIALSGFQKGLMAEAGLPDAAIHVKPNFYADPPDALPWVRRKDKIVFIGRLGEEKGVQVLIQAWKAWGAKAPLLEVIGDGPLRKALSEAVSGDGLGGKIVFRGQLPFDETQQSLSRARLLILPSLCFEGFPMVVREAFALGVPVVASRLGPLPDIVKEGVAGALFEAGNAEDLLRVVRSIWSDQDRLAELAGGARKMFEEKYTADTNYLTLMEIYEAAIRRRRHKKS